ncbi:hypothetical protein GEMRC1_007276 [Eukaryota sp. GEM-RC1]
MAIPEGNPTTFTCHHQIEYTVYNSPQSRRWNLSGLYGDDHLQLADLYWFGGSIEVKKTDVYDMLYSVHADTRGFHNGAIMNIHTLGTLGGFGEITVSGVNTWNVLPDARLQFISSVDFRSIESGKTRNSYLNNYGHLDFPVNNISVNLAFNTQQLNEFTASRGVSVTYDGWSYSTGQYYLEENTRLFLNHFDHEFTNQVNAHGPGNIHMSDWIYHWSNHWSNHVVSFDADWTLSPKFSQDYGKWVFGPNSVVNLTDIVLTGRVWLYVDGSTPAMGNWTFDYLSIEEDSYMVFGDTKEEITSKSLRMTSSEYVRFVDTATASEFTDIEIYNGEVEFSTGHNLRFNNLIIHGGRLTGTDNIIVDNFVWNCGLIEKTSSSITVLYTGSIGTCTSTQFVNKPPQKRILLTSSLFFSPGSVLLIDTGNAIALSDSSLMTVQGLAEIRKVQFTGTVQKVTFKGPQTELFENHLRRFDLHVIFETPVYHFAGVSRFSRYLDVHSLVLLQSSSTSPTGLEFSYGTSLHSFIFHDSSNVTEVIDGEFSTVAHFRPISSSVNVFVKGVFSSRLLSYNTGTVTFTGPIDLSIDAIRLPLDNVLYRTPNLHFHNLSNDLGSVKGFELRSRSVMKFSTGLGLVTFDGYGLLQDSAEIVGDGDNIIINGTSVAADPDGFDDASGDVFTWSGGTFRGNMEVNVYNVLQLTGGADKRIITSTGSSGHLTGFDNASLVISPTGVLNLNNDAVFSCRVPNDPPIAAPCYCDATLIIEGTFTQLPFAVTSFFCWRIEVEGLLQLQFGNLRAYNSLSGNGLFKLEDSTTIMFASAKYPSFIGPNSTFLSDGTIELMYDTTVYIQGFFSTSVLVSVQEGTLIFDDGAVLDIPFNLDVLMGNVFFNKVAQMVTLINVHVTQGNVTLNTDGVVNITNLFIDEIGFIHGPNLARVNTLKWTGGGLGLNCHLWIMNYGEVAEENFYKYMLKDSKLVVKSSFDFIGPGDLFGGFATIINEGVVSVIGSFRLSEMPTPANSTSSYHLSNKFINYGDLEVLGQFDCGYVITHNGTSMTVMAGELLMIGGGQSFAPVYCFPGSRIGVMDEVFVFEHANTSYIDGDFFTFVIRQSNGMIVVKTLFSLKECAIQNEGTFHVTDQAFIADEVSIVVRGTHVIFDEFVNPEVPFEMLTIEVHGVVSLYTNHTIFLKTLEISGGFRAGTDTVYVQNRFTWQRGGGFMNPGLTIAEKGCVIEDMFEKEVLDAATVIFEDEVQWMTYCSIIGGTNASIIFNDLLYVYNGGSFLLPFKEPEPLLLSSYVHTTPDELPVVYVNHGMVLHTTEMSDIDFEFSWELQNRGNISLPSEFVMRLFRGGYDSADGRLLSTPGSYIEYGPGYNYHYNPDTWCYYNQSVIRMFQGGRSEYAGFVCFNQAKIGPYGTLAFLENVTICTYSSLSIEGTELVIEGSVTFCDLTLATDFVVNPGQSLIISCSLTWLTGTLSGRGSVEILPGACLYIHPKDPEDDDFYHIIDENTRIINRGVGEINANITGGFESQFINHGHTNLMYGHWLNDPLVNASTAISTFINFNRTVITYDEPLLFDWNVSQIAGEFVIAKGEIFFSEYSTFSGDFETLPNTIVHVEKDFTFTAANLYLKSPQILPKSHSTISFLESSNVNWIDIDFTLDSINATLVFDSGTNITQSPNEFKLKSGLIDILSVDSSFSIENLVQSGGIIHVDSLTTGSYISNLKLLKGKIVSNSPWTIEDAELIGGIFTGSDVLTLASSTITATSTVTCDASIKSLSATFASGLASGTESCVIDSHSFVVDTSSSVTLDGCSSTFINNDTLLVKKGPLIFQMDLINHGSVHVESLLTFSKCQFSIDKTISTSSDGSIIIDSPTTFTSDSLISGNGTLTFDADSVVNGIVDFDGCVIINEGVEVVFSSATIIHMNLCLVKGNVTLRESSISELNIVHLDGGNVVFEDGTIGTFVDVVRITSGELKFKHSVIDGFNVQDLNGGDIVFDPSSVVHVKNYTQTDGSTVIQGSFVYFNLSNVVIYDGSFTAIAGFNPINSNVIVHGDVSFDQFESTPTQLMNLVLESGKFVSTTDYPLNISNLLWNDGTFGGKYVRVADAVWNHGVMNASSLVYVDSILLTDLTDKIFDDDANLWIKQTGTWNKGSVIGNSGSRVDLPSNSTLVLAGTEGWYVNDGSYPNSAIYTQGDLVFSTPDSIDMEWDIHGKRIDVNHGDVVFSDNLVVIKEVYVNVSTTSYLSAKMNVSEYIGGCGDIVINDPDSLVAFNGKVDLCGTLYMKDGLLDLRLSDIQNITIDYTGGTILFREDIEGQDINLPQVQTPLDITQTNAKLVNIGICNSTINVLTSNISKFVVSEMHKNCKINFLPDAIVGELIIKDMYDGKLNIKDGSDIKFDQITQHDGVVTVEKEAHLPLMMLLLLLMTEHSFLWKILMLNSQMLTQQ